MDFPPDTVNWLCRQFQKDNLSEDSISIIRIREQFFKVISLRANNHLHVLKEKDIA